jgi:hypothetical protein
MRSQKKSSSSSGSSPVESTKKPTNVSANTTTTNNPISFLRSNTRPDNSQEQNNSAQRNLNQTTTPSEPKKTIQGLFGPVSAHDIENEKPTPMFIPQSQDKKPNRSIFEKVDTHGGGTVYLGSGDSSELEDCIRNCLSRNQPHPEYTYHTTKYSFPHKSLTRASVLDDYSYEGISSFDRHILHSVCDHDHHISHTICDHHHHYHDYSDCHHYDRHHYDHCHCHDHRRHASDLSLDEIRQVNDALTKCGVPVTSHLDHPSSLYNKPRPVGDIISACQQLLVDPALRAQRDGTNAVQHVWDNLHYHSPQTNMYGYASPAVRGVASHLFTPQNIYDPVHSVASHLFPNSPQQSPYNPAPSAISNLFGNPQQSAYNPAPSAISNLFGNPQQSAYNPPPSAAPPPFGNPQPSSNPGQSAISRLFGNPQPSSNLFSGQQQASPYGTSY